MVKQKATKRDDYRRNLFWLTVALAPAGWCHVKNTMIGSLVEDLADGLPFADRKSTRLNSSHIQKSRMPSSA